MDTEDSLVQTIAALDSEQANIVDSLIGRKIWNIEILEEKNESAIKIQFSEQELDYILIYGKDMDMYVVTPKPDRTH